MLKSKNIEVQKFLDDIMVSDDKKFDILQELRQIIFNEYVEVSEKIMYGGIMFTLEGDFGGLFVRKNHISFEFVSGYLFDDPKGLLEGSGRFRRHLKIKTFSNIVERQVDFFVKQCLK